MLKKKVLTPVELPGARKDVLKSNVSFKEAGLAAVVGVRSSSPFSILFRSAMRRSLAFLNAFFVVCVFFPTRAVGASRLSFERLRSSRPCGCFVGTLCLVGVAGEDVRATELATGLREENEKAADGNFTLLSASGVLSAGSSIPRPVAPRSAWFALVTVGRSTKLSEV